MVEAARPPLHRVLGDELGAVFADLHRAHGVDVPVRRRGEARSGADGASRVLLDGGTAAGRPGAGRRRHPAGHPSWPPRPGWPSTTASWSTPRCAPPTRTSTPPATWPTWTSPLLGRRVRVEHWANALNGGPAAAKSMLGQDVTYDRVPYFFSDQYDLGMEYAGCARAGRVRPGGRPRRPGRAAEFVAFWLSGGRVLAGMNVNVWDVTDDDPGPRPPRHPGRPRPRWPTRRCRSTSSEPPGLGASAAGDRVGSAHGAAYTSNSSTCIRHVRAAGGPGHRIAGWRGGSGTRTSRWSGSAPRSRTSSREYVTLRRAGGGNLKGLCPFHDEKTPVVQRRARPRRLPLLRLRRGRRRDHVRAWTPST